MSETDLPPVLDDERDGLNQNHLPGEPPPAAPRRWPWVVILVLVVLAAGYYFLRPTNNGPQSGSATTGKASGKGAGGGGAIPVVATKVRQGDIDVYFDGLGSVIPIYTVSVRSRVDGQLMQVLYREGQLVHQGDRLVEIDSRPYEAQLTQFEGLLQRDEALLENARIDLTRYETLVKQNAAPEQQLATQQALVKQLEGTVKNDQGQIDTAKLNITYSHINAPISGVVGLRLVDPGNIVHASDANGLLVITQVQPISMIFTIAEDQLPTVQQKLRAGQHLEVDAYDRVGQNKIAQGRLETIDNQIDPSTGSLRLRAIFDNRNNALFPNQFVNARLLVEQKHGVTLMANAAIQRGTQSTYVYMVKPDSTVTVRQVTVGTTEGNDAEVTSGLSPGDVVVMTGVDKLLEGTKVNVHSANEQGGQGSASPQGGQGSANPQGGQGSASPQGGQGSAKGQGSQGHPHGQGGKGSQ